MADSPENRRSMFSLAIFRRKFEKVLRLKRTGRGKGGGCPTKLCAFALLCHFYFLLAGPAPFYCSFHLPSGRATHGAFWLMRYPLTGLHPNPFRSMASSCIGEASPIQPTPVLARSCLVLVREASSMRQCPDSRKCKTNKLHFSHNCVPFPISRFPAALPPHLWWFSQPSPDFPSRTQFSTAHAWDTYANVGHSGARCIWNVNCKIKNYKFEINNIII